MTLIYSMGVSLDGFINDRHGDFGWGAPSDDLFRFHLERVRGLSAHFCGRKLYETMLPWETDDSMRSNDLMSEFADVWSALPKIVFSRTLDAVEGNARLAEASLPDEIARVLATPDDVAGEVGGAGLASSAVELGLVDELRIFRYPVVVGGGTPYLPPVSETVGLELLESHVFDERVVYERYAVVRG